MKNLGQTYSEFMWKIYLSMTKAEYVYAHRWEITPTGDLIFFAENDDKNPCVAFAVGQ